MNGGESSNSEGGGHTEKTPESELQHSDDFSVSDGSLNSTRFTSNLEKVASDSVSGQVNLEVNRDRVGSLRGSLHAEQTVPVTNSEMPQSNGENSDTLSESEEAAIEYVRTRLQTHADLYREGRADDLSGFSAGFLRSEANRKYGTDLVNDDVEAIWQELVGA